MAKTGSTFTLSETMPPTGDSASTSPANASESQLAPRPDVATSTDRLDKEQAAVAGQDGSSSSHSLTRSEIERLGRQRPAVFTSWLSEDGFVFTIVMSMMISEFFIGGFSILPQVVDALAIPPASRTWPAGVINLTAAALLQPFARLCDIYGGRLVFLCGLAWLLVWSLACGFSNDTNLFIVCRAIQGVGAAAFLPAGLALLAQVFRPGPRKNFVFTIYGAFACVGFYWGIFMGAIAAEFLNWRWYFWIGAIFCLAIGLTGVFSIPRHLGHEDPGAKMDWPGVVTIVPGLVLVVFALTDGGSAPQGWRTPYIYVTLVLGILFLCAAVYVQGWVSSQPLLPPDLFKPKYMKRLMSALFCSYGVFGIYLFYASFYIETVMHTPPILAAAWFTPLAVTGMFLVIGGGLVLHIIPNRILMIISACGFLLSCLFAVIPDPADSGKSTSFLYWAYVFPAMLGSTIGIDITFNISNIFITTAMPRRLQAAAGGLINSLLFIGFAFWLGVVELAITAKVQARGAEIAPRNRYQIGFWTGVALAIVSLALTATVRMGQAEAALTADEKVEKERAELAAALRKDGVEAAGA